MVLTIDAMTLKVAGVVSFYMSSALVVCINFLCRLWLTLCDVD